MSEEIKAPEIEGFELCTYDEWKKLKASSNASVYFANISFYYKRIKPKEKSIREIVHRCFPTTEYPGSWQLGLTDCFEEILSNYVKKEG